MLNPSPRRPLAQARQLVYYAEDASFTIELVTGGCLWFPAALIPELAGATPAQLQAGVLTTRGMLFWEALKVTLPVSEVVGRLAFGVDWREQMRRQVFSEMGRKRSPAKAAAARENGQAGGWPGDFAPKGGG